MHMNLCVTQLLKPGFSYPTSSNKGHSLLFTIAKMARFRDREDRDQRLSSPSLGSLAIRSIPDRIVPALASELFASLCLCSLDGITLWTKLSLDSSTRVQTLFIRFTPICEAVRLWLRFSIYLRRLHLNLYPDG